MEASRELVGNHRFCGPVAAYQGMAGEESGNDGGQVLDILNTKGRDWDSLGRFQQDNWCWQAASETVRGGRHR